MTSPDKLLALAARCEREEPNFVLDAAIAEACGWIKQVNSDLTWWRKPDSDKWGLHPLYTSSLDAAVTLVPEGWNWSVEFFTFDAVIPYRNPVAKASMWHDSRNPCERIFNQKARTPVLALCAAALKARAALAERGDDLCAT